MAKTTKKKLKNCYQSDSEWTMKMRSVSIFFITCTKGRVQNLSFSFQCGKKKKLWTKSAVSSAKKKTNLQETAEFPENNPEDKPDNNSEDHPEDNPENNPENNPKNNPQDVKDGNELEEI